MSVGPEIPGLCSLPLSHQSGCLSEFRGHWQHRIFGLSIEERERESNMEDQAGGGYKPTS